MNRMILCGKGVFYMLKKTIALFLSILIAFTAACAVRRSEPKEQPSKVQNELEKPERKEGREQPKEQPKREDKLSKSDQEAVEENINGLDLEEDLEITNEAEAGQMIQSRVGLTPIEVEKMSRQEAVTGSVTVLQEFRTKVPDEIQVDLQYDKYPLSYDYLLVTAEGKVDILDKPLKSASAVCQGMNGEKLTLHQKVSGEAIGDSNIWYKVSCKDNGEVKTGYIHSSNGVPRKFQFDKMLEAVRKLEREVKAGDLNFISNYKNANGAPPSKGDRATDEYGYRIYQSAPGYEKADTGSDFRYLPDGILLRILDESGDFYRVKVPSFEGEYYVPKKYIDPEDTLDTLSHVIVVDRSQQNQATFELSPQGDVRMISYTLATTGLQGDLSFATPLGYYKAIEKKERFQYLKDGSSEIAGYAPWAIRFTGGAYVHGVPVAYEEEDGKQVDPGPIEYLHTIGTFPRSHMCVRNYTSHAQFLYDWMDPKVGAVIVIE